MELKILNWNINWSFPIDDPNPMTTAEAVVSVSARGDGVREFKKQFEKFIHCINEGETMAPLNYESTSYSCVETQRKYLLDQDKKSQKEAEESRERIREGINSKTMSRNLEGQRKFLDAQKARAADAQAKKAKVKKLLTGNAGRGAKKEPKPEHFVADRYEVREHPSIVSATGFRNWGIHDLKTYSCLSSFSFRYDEREAAEDLCTALNVGHKLREKIQKSGE